MTTASRLGRPGTWFATALVCALVTVVFAFTLFGLIAEAVTVVCLVVGAATLIGRRRKA